MKQLVVLCSCYKDYFSVFWTKCQTVIEFELDKLCLNDKKKIFDIFNFYLCGPKN